MKVKKSKKRMGLLMKKKFKFAALSCALGLGLVGTTLFSSQASASSLDTKVVSLENSSQEPTVEYGKTSGLLKFGQKAWVYGTEAAKFYAKDVAQMYLDNGGLAPANEFKGNADIIFDQK
ncbi:hypothetical protein SAMN04487922_13612 [Bacillus toyonensis]|nr:MULTISPECIES: hypothetical protein [Bacillus cereus group]EEL36820.1 hypothetical protein bcere0020_57840 [Bacillus cereus Rock3-29]MCG3797423.1 hypothetical protein [Bacillus toyonensis]MDA1876729.1 hypothetical protein [Bacillus cereus group sp. BY112LC]MED2616232.1 hypothetical protein [Bacillus toyonensis]WIG34261.1 hypothetical protein QPL83_01585 [Bacillus toyonensis]